jgi:hypothetical protein
MMPTFLRPGLLLFLFTALFSLILAQTSPSITPTSSTASPPTTTSTLPTTTSQAATNSTPPDVLLNVPNLSDGRIELDVDNLSADINLNANVANLVSINAGVQVSIRKVNLIIVDVDASLELIVRLGHLADIVNRVFSSIDLNPLLITAINNVTSILGTVVGAVDGLLGSVTSGGTTLNFLVDNLGNIVQQVAGTGGSLVSTIVGDHLQNMTYTGQQEVLQGGLVQKTYSYAPLNALVNIVFNAAGQVVQATAQKNTGASTSTASALPTTR